MPQERHDQDPYAPPPRHKDKSGALVRVVLLAAMLGVAVWGYTQFSEPTAPTLVAQEETQQMADGSYDVTPTPAAPAAESAATPAPAAEPQPAAPPAEPAPPAE